MRIVANWKQFLSPEEEISLLQRVIAEQALFANLTLTVLPSFLSLRECEKLISSNETLITLGAQDVSTSLIEAQTGNVRADYLPVDTVLIGHSEREKNNNETTADHIKKLKLAVSLNKKVILCFGERVKIGDDSELLAVIKEQLAKYREAIAAEMLQHVTLAYEPQWSIGSTQTASSTIVKKVLALTQTFGFKKMLYGGSIDSSTVAQIYFPTLAGFLVGRASTKFETLKDLVASLNMLT